MPPATKLEVKVEAIAASLEGDEGIRVRLALVEVGLKEHREASVCYPDWGCKHYAGREQQWKSIQWDDTARRWKIATTVIDALIAQHNAATAAAYESYRIACEQGVAVPPEAGK